MWDWFIGFLTNVLWNLQHVVGDWGLAVIILTVFVRILLTPLMNHSSKAMARMQVAQPKLKAIQEKYAEDPQRQAEELRKAYSELKFNPLGGCLPIFLQMPIFIALFSVAHNVPADASFYSILPSITSSPAHMLATQGFVTALPYIIADVLFGVLTFIPMITNPAMSDPAQRKQSMTMGVVMSLMMLWFGWSVPAAVLLYYITSALWQVIQQKLVTQKVIAEAKAEAEASVANYETYDVVRREKKPRPRKKSN